ncbi:MAG: hypothetical protein ABIR37_01750, partial [Candidatus Saccharimonadales bacterium]
MEDKTEVKQEFVELRAKGNSYTRIATKLKVSKATLIAWSKELKEDIANHSSIENEALLERHSMAKHH